MRTIKFRGKRIDNGEWIVGDLLHIAGGCLIYFGSDTDTTEPDIEKSNPIAVEFFKDEIAVVDYDTVEQFTGLLDKNGTEIYEGDILRLGNSDSGVCEVGWSESVSAYCIRFHFEAELGLKPLGSWKECERNIVVIGNIHDNPELLKGGESNE